MENKKNNLLKIFIIAIIVVFSINIGIIEASKKSVKQKADAAMEEKRPANVSIIMIKNSSCGDCADIGPILEAVKKTNINIAKEETFDSASQEAKNLIDELAIKKLPTFIIKGEIEKNDDVRNLLNQIGEIKNDTFKFNYAAAPYWDLASNSIKGKVTVTFISDKICKDCYDINPFKQILAGNLGMLNPSIIALDRGDKAAQNMIYKYNIISVPTLVLSGDVSEYQKLTGIWLEIGTLEKDGSYVLRDIKKVNPNLIYRDLKTGKIIKPEAPNVPATSPSPSAAPSAK